MESCSLDPVVDRKVLILLAGLMWCGVGVMLFSFSVEWLSHSQHKVLFYLAGIAAAMPIHHFGFLKLADRNLNRLLPLTEKKCIFSFMTWQSYIIVVIMIAMGITLRHSMIPKNDLSVIYTGIGMGLFLSGMRYLRNFLMLISK
ncbi:MAG: hypothetical protein WCE64_11595 [Bacteroidales bacterium]